MAETDLQEPKVQNEASGDTHVMSEETKTPREIYIEEWENPMNWGGPGNMAVYFSKRDKRIWVPKHKPAIGWTVNLAHTGGILWLVGVCMGIIIVLAFIVSWLFADYLLHVLK